VSRIIERAEPETIDAGTRPAFGAVAMCVALLIVLVLVVSRGLADQPVAAGLFIALGFFLLAPAALSAARGSFNPLESINFFLGLYAYVYLIKPVVRIARGEDFLFGVSSLPWAIGVSIIGLLVFYAGYYSKLGGAVARGVPLLPATTRPRRLRAYAWAFIAIGGAALWTYMELSGGWREFWSRPHGYGGRADLTTAYLYQLPELMIVGFLLMVYDVMYRERRTFADVLRLTAAGAGGVGVYSILWGRRTFVAWLVISIFTMYYLRRGRVPRLLTVAFFGLFLFAAMTATLAYRMELHLGSSLEALGAIDPVQTAPGTVSGIGDEFDSFLAIVSLYPERLPYDYFWLYSMIPLHPIPRMWWPGKPALFVSSWDDLLFESHLAVGASESLLGDFYIQLGVAGVVIGMFVCGMFVKFVFAYLQRAPLNGWIQLLYAVAIGNFPSLIVQSGISAVWKWLPFMVPAIVATAWLASSGREPEDARIGASP
jgi:hypothetical protein